MDHDDAIALIRDAVMTPGSAWADLGAGSGTFTRALAALLGPGGVVYAVDRDARAMRALARGDANGAEIETRVGDFTVDVDLPLLDGALLANALHFVPYEEQVRVLGHIAGRVKDRGTIAIVEYERRNANPYVPFPITFAALGRLADEAGLGAPTLLATRPSRYQGSIYSASLGVRHGGLLADD